MPALRSVARFPAVVGAIGASSAALTVALLGAPAVAAEPVAALQPVQAVPAGVDDFTFDRFDAVYELGRDDDRRSELRITETLVAVFPEFDQNHGIRRAIPRDYDGHPTDLRIESVTDGTGAPRSYETERSEDGEFELVTIAADDFVHGEQTYVITYHQQNVTFEPDDAPQQEFYWDVNGTGWAQPFGRVRAEVRLEDGLVDALSGDSACYRGYEGSSTPCEVLTVDPASDPVVVAEASSLGPYENLTVAIGFRPGTFEPRDERFTSSPAAMTSAITALLALGVAITAAAMRAVRWRNHPGRGIIVAEYEPPEGVSLMEAADLVRAPEKGITATILAEAVAGRLRVVETGRKKYAVELARGGDESDRDAQQVLRALFGSYAPAGTRRDLKSRDTALGTTLMNLRRKVHARVAKEGLRRRPDLGWRVLLTLAAIAAAVIAVWAGIIALDDRMGGAWPWLPIAVAVLAAIATLWIVAGVRPLTERGRALRDHLDGLREFIRLAEADRIRMLQSPSGAERVAVADGGATPASRGVDPEQVLRVTERLLPYAVLFKQEREWSDVLAALYAERGREPGWYSGRDGFNAVAFSAGVSSFTSASSTSWSGSSSSSSSSGSGGGGSSGGGGGGGGGGGV